ncbi:MAG: peptidylprolyl isomerase [Desulfobulbaceae bacterium]|nr:peptidylprolyl isomerase [Desulfobulbaceae bacterium]
MLRAVLIAVMFFLPLAAHANPATPAHVVGDSPTVTFETTLGNIVIELYADKAPVTVANFRRYVRESYYDNLLFHRVISGFVIQGGGFASGMTPRQPTHPAIANEAGNGLLNKRGTLSMARTYLVNSATSQFFINLSDNPALDHQGNDPARFGYAVFGRVVEGMDVVDKIAAKATRSVGGHQDVPAKEIMIIKAFESSGKK